MTDPALNVGRILATLNALQRKTALYIVSGFVLFVVLTISACSDDPGDPDEGGIIGTGIILQGTVNEPAFASNSVVDVKSADGRLSQLSIDASQRFSTTSLPGTGPWVMSVRASADFAMYGIAYSDGTRNINRFSDLSLRNWFARNSLDLDGEFASSEQFEKLPSAVEYAETASSVFQLIEPVLNSYNVRGEDTLSATYNNDDQGVDAFLNRNSVLIEKDVVKFVFTDPVTKTQTVTGSELSLQSEFRDTGSSGPIAVSGVRAIGSSSDEIIVIWEPSVDDVAVLAYDVVRDGALIATTPYPVYVDSNISVVKPYSYNILAVDGANNPSPASAPAIASPLVNSNDDVAPPAPFMLSKLKASGSAIQVYWLHDDISDVVSFNVYRGSGAQEVELELEPWLKVTGTLASDTTVQENDTYCYQVQAQDASGNLSDRSEALCVMASGIANGANVPLVEWVVPNIDSLDCGEILSSARVERGNTVLTAGCYSVPDNLSIGAGATLTLTEGAVVKFGEDVKLFIPKEATFTSIGTPENPVVLTGQVPIRGAWGGIEFQGSRSVGNLLRGTVVQYAGGTVSRAAINVTTDVSRVRIEDSLIRFNLNDAINFNWDNVIIDSFRGNRITGNETAGFVALHTLQSLVGNSEYTDNENNVIIIGSRRYDDRQISIPDLGILYRWNGTKISRGSLAIEPGTEFSMIDGAVVDVNGSFTAAGTASLPIVMKGRSSTWDGLLLSGRGDKTINHVRMIDAGEVGEGNGAIEVVCTLEDAAKLSIDNTDITDSESWGIFVSGSGCDTEIGMNNTYSNNALGNVSVP